MGECVFFLSLSLLLKTDYCRSNDQKVFKRDDQNGLRILAEIRPLLLD